MTKKNILFISFGSGVGGPQRWLEGLLDNKTLQAEIRYDTWYVADEYRGVHGKIKLFQECKRQILSKRFDKIYINHDLNLAALLVLNFSLTVKPLVFDQGQSS